MIRRRLSWGLLSVLACAGPAQAATWTDPSFDQLFAEAELIALVAAVGGPADEGGLHAVKVLRALRGGVAGGAERRIGSLYDPDRDEGPRLEAGARFWVFARVRDGALRIATPTFGLFPVQDGMVNAALRDTSIRVPVALADYEAFLGALENRRRGGLDSSDAAWLLKRRANLDGADLKELGGESAAVLHLNLEVLARFGESADLERVTRCLGCELFQVRASAVRALGAIGGEKAVAALVARAATDRVATVASWAAIALARQEALPAGLGATLAARLSEAAAVEVRLHKSVADPRQNTLPSARATLFRILGRIKEKSALEALLRALEGREVELVEAALEALVDFGDKDLLGPIIARMRVDDAADAWLNKLFAKALTRATGQVLDGTREAWETWWRERAKQGSGGE